MIYQNNGYTCVLKREMCFYHPYIANFRVCFVIEFRGVTVGS
jgi:hypothetical protein